MGYIYLIENNINELKYIGLTTRTVEERWKEHLRHSSEVIGKAILKYGKENFKCAIIEECPDEILDEREQYWINYYDSYNNGYNCTEGGRRSGLNIEVQSKYKIIKELWDEGYGQKQIQIKTGFNIETVHSYLLKYGVSKEQIRLRANEGIRKSKEKPIVQYSKNGDFIKEWPSATAAGRELGINRRNICGVCLGKRKTCNGFIWRYKEIENEQMDY